MKLKISYNRNTKHNLASTLGEWQYIEVYTLDDDYTVGYGAHIWCYPKIMAFGWEIETRDENFDLDDLENRTTEHFAEEIAKIDNGAVKAALLKTIDFMKSVRPSIKCEDLSKSALAKIWKSVFLHND